MNYLKYCDICGTKKDLREVGIFRVLKPAGEKPEKQEIVGIKVVCPECQRYVDIYLDTMVDVLKYNYMQGVFTVR